MNNNEVLLRKLISVLQNENSKKLDGNTLYGTVEVDSETGKKYVILDGSDVRTAIVEGTDVINGDRVLVSLENHQAIVMANITSPASARTAKNYMDFSETDEGLVIGDLTDPDNDFNVLIKADGVYVRNGAVVLAAYKGDGTHLYDDNSNIVATFSDLGMTLFNSDHDEIATFGWETSGADQGSPKVILTRGDSYAKLTSGLMQFRWKNNSGSYLYNTLNQTGLSLHDYSSHGGYSIGKVISGFNDDSVSIPSQTWRTSLEYVTLTTGVWIIEFGGAFSGGTGGTRQFVLNQSSSGTPSPTREDICIAPTNGLDVKAKSTRIVTVGQSSKSYYLHAYSGASAAVTVYPFLEAVKIG